MDISALLHLRRNIQRAGHDGGDAADRQFCPEVRSSGVLRPHHPRVERRFGPVGRLSPERLPFLFLRTFSGHDRHRRHYGWGAVHLRYDDTAGGDQLRDRDGGAFGRVGDPHRGGGAVQGVQGACRVPGHESGDAEIFSVQKELVQSDPLPDHRHDRRGAARRRGDDCLVSGVRGGGEDIEGTGEVRPRRHRWADGFGVREQRLHRRLHDHPALAGASGQQHDRHDDRGLHDPRDAAGSASSFHPSGNRLRDLRGDAPLQSVPAGLDDHGNPALSRVEPASILRLFRCDHYPLRYRGLRFAEQR